MFRLAVIVVVLAAVACGPAYSELKTVPEGQFVSLSLPKGTYRLELTSAGNGVTVQWIGGVCPGQPSETNLHNEACELEQAGQVVITNPTTFGLGADAVVSIAIYDDKKWYR